MARIRTIPEINERMNSGQAVVMTADEVVELARERGADEVYRTVDVVTTATFGAMCSSGALINTGHADPPIKFSQAHVNDVPAYCGLAAVDLYIGATEPATNRADYGGAHVIADLVAGRQVHLRATGARTDCYPRSELETAISLDTVNQAVLLNPRNIYQNYCAATNSSDRLLHTYMGTLLPRHGNVTYATTGQLSPLLNDPGLRTIGIGSPVYLAGARGYVAWEGTQHYTGRPAGAGGAPIGPGATVTLVGDLKQMRTEYLRAASFYGYGTSLFVGVGIPIPVLDRELAESLCLSDDDLETIILDYAVPSRDRPVVARVSYGQLRRGEVELGGKKTRTAPLSGRRVSREIAEELKQMVLDGVFPLAEPIAPLPDRPSLSALTETGAWSQ